VAGNADESHQSLSPRFDQCFERAARSQSGSPLILGCQVVHLDQIDLIDPQPLERAMETVARALIRAVAGFGGEKKPLAMLAHPRADAQLRLAVRGRGVEMIDAVFEEHLEHAVGFVLLHPAERSGSKKNPSTLMPRFSKWTCLNHDITSPDFSCGSSYRERQNIATPNGRACNANKFRCGHGE